MKNTINNKLRRLPGMLAGLLLLAAAACNPESLRPDYETDDSARSAMTLEFGISAADAGVRTRSATTGDEMSETFKNTEVQSLWIGVFDVETGDLVGKMHTKKINYLDDDAIIPDPDSLSVSGKAKVDILYYDAHPTVRIFGVANYDKVKAHDGIIENNEVAELGDPIDLYEILESVESMSEFFAISVDAKSANEAQLANGAPLMMGVYSESEDIFTIKAEVIGSGDATTVNFDKGFGNADKKLVDNMYDRLQYKNLTGSIRLRRLLSQVNVEVKAGAPGIKVSNLHYRKVNMPKEVYLQERQTTDNNGAFKTWKYLTPNIADALVKTDNIPGAVARTPYYESDEEFIPALEAEMSFQFHQYENKHWGLPGVEREKTRQMTDFDGNPVFSALCSETETGTIYNNYASYFEIKLDVTDEDEDQRGTVIYRIHEGLCNDANGRPSFNNQLDFCCFRNTIYNYTITVYGLNSFDVTAKGHNHDAGVVEGTLTSRGEDVLIEAEKDPISFQGKLLAYVCYYENNNEPIIYGDGDEDQIELLRQAFPVLSANAGKWIDGEEAAAANFGFMFGDTDLRKYESLDKVSGSITVPNDPRKNETDNPKNHLQALYVLVDASKADDPCANYKYYRYYYYPVDKRSPIIEDAQFLLKFANEWDEEADKDNGAVTGYIQAIKFSKEAVEIPADATPEYKVYLDDNLVYTGKELETIDLWTLCNDTQKEKFIAYSIHKVKVTISDVSEAANYIDYDSPEIPFAVYPTNFKWDYNDNKQWDKSEAWKGNDGLSLESSYVFYGDPAQSYDKYVTNQQNYFGLRHSKSMTVKGNDSNRYYLQTMGGNRQQAFTLNSLYNAVLTITCSNTGNTIAYPDGDGAYRYLSVYNGGHESISYAGVKAGQNAGEGAASYSFYIEKGEVQIFTYKSLNIYSIELKYLDPNVQHTATWNFSDSKWAPAIAYLETAPTQNINLSCDGLHILSGYNTNPPTSNSNASISSGTNGNDAYVNLGGGGSVGDSDDTTRRVFWFWAFKSGTIKVFAATSDKNYVQRNVIVNVGGQIDGNDDYWTVGDTSKPKSPTVEKKINVNGPTKIYVYSKSNGLYVYEINYEED